MGTTLQAEWLDGSRRQALKYVLKWEIQSLLQRLADIGEETVLLTADLENGNAGQMGSDKGHSFLVSSELHDVKARFLSFCSESLSSNKRPNTSNSCCKKSQKRSREDSSEDKLDQQLPVGCSDENDTDLGAGDTRHKRKKLGPLSKRRKERKKSQTGGDANSSTDEYDLQENHTPTKSGNHSSHHEISENQSDLLGLTGSVRPETLNQSSDSDNSDTQSKKDYSSGANEIKLTRTRPKLYNNLKSQTLSPGDNNFNLKTKNRKGKQKLNHSQLFLESDIGSRLNEELESTGGVALEDISPLVQPGNCRTVLTEDGGMMIIPDTEIKTEAVEYTSEDSDFLSTFYPRPGSRDFKSASSDEIPTETAILDAAKLGVRRYQCPICMLIVRDRHDLKRHLRTHTKVKPYHCEICSRNFSRKWDLENHMRRHQEETLKESTTKGPLTMVDLDELKLQLGAVGKSSNKGGYSGEEDGDCKGNNFDEPNVQLGALKKNSSKGSYDESKGDNSNIDDVVEDEGVDHRLYLKSKKPLVKVKEECLGDTS